MSMMSRATKANVCPICGNDTWCLIGHTVIYCMRTTSPRSKTFKGGEVGYMHPHPSPDKQRVPERHITRKPPTLNVMKLLNSWHDECTDHRIEQLATVLGVTCQSLISLECCRAPYKSLTWAFTMRDGYGNRIGIRLRNLEGSKWAVTGSQAGIFIPSMPVESRMFVVEGPTNTAAALSLGLFAIGRPSCSGGVSHIQDYVRRHKQIREVVVVGDNDKDKPDPNRPGEWKINPGVTGAKGLQDWLTVPSCILMLPTNDIRDFIRIGDKSAVDAMVEQLVWTKPRKAA